MTIDSNPFTEATRLATTQIATQVATQSATPSPGNPPSKLLSKSLGKPLSKSPAKTHTATVAQAHWDGPLGTMILATTAHGLCGAWFTDQGHVPAKTPWPMQPEHPVLAAAQNQLRDYFAGQRRHFDLPLDLGAGTQFQQDIWRALLGIAQGRTSTYGQVSVASGHAHAVRAVGGAIGRNPLSIIVPCHRVIGANGTLTGYDGGLHRKSFLLTLEGVL